MHVIICSQVEGRWEIAGRCDPVIPTRVNHTRVAKVSAAAFIEKKTAVTVACSDEVNLPVPHCAAGSISSARIVVTTFHSSLNIREGNSSPSVLKAF